MDADHAMFLWRTPGLTVPGQFPEVSWTEAWRRSRTHGILALTCVLRDRSGTFVRGYSAML